MSKEAILIFQDCPDCGANEGWYKKQTEIAKSKGIIIRKASFIEPGIKGLIIKAASQGIDRMPFFADDSTSPRKFSYNIADLFPKPQKITKKLRKKAVLEKEPKITGSKTENGSNPES